MNQYKLNIKFYKKSKQKKIEISKWKFLKCLSEEWNQTHREFARYALFAEYLSILYTQQSFPHTVVSLDTTVCVAKEFRLCITNPILGSSHRH